MVFSAIVSSASKFIAQIQQLASKGVGADRIFRIVREFAKIPDGARSPMPRSQVRTVVKEFKQRVAASRASLPLKRSERLKVSMGVETQFRSPLNFRYLLEFDFKIRNSVTGQIKTFRNTIGFRRLDRMGVFMDIARQRVETFNFEEDNLYLPLGFEGLPDTISFVALFRTTNR